MKNVVFFVAFIGLGIILAAGYYLLRKNNPARIIQPKPAIPATQFSIEKAPKESIRGNIATFSGDVQWQSRTATELTNLTALGTVQQGEIYQTGDGGNLVINFLNFGSVRLQSKSQIEIFQTLPIDFVFNQASGSATYVSSGKSPFSIRSLHLLTTLASGSATINVDFKKHLITLSLKNNPAIVAYNDTQYISHVLNLAASDNFNFNDDLRQGTIY